MREPIKVGILGLGRSGWDIHCIGMEKHDGFHVVAVTDRESTRRDEAVARFGCRAYQSASEVIDDGEVELVVVATPSHTHAALCIEAARAGKQILVEKPMALDAEEAGAMIDCARACGVTLTPFQVRRMHGDFRKVREIVRSGVLGPLHLIKIQAHTYIRRGDWQTLRKFGGGTLNNFGAHYIDHALALMGGKWCDLFADVRHVISAGDADDHVKVVFRGENGVIVDVEISNAAATPDRPPHWTILGQYGALSGSQKCLKWRYYDPQSVAARVLNESTSTPQRIYEGPEALPWIKESFEVQPANAIQQFYDHYFDFLRNGGPSPAPPEEAQRLIALFDACRAQNPML